MPCCIRPVTAFDELGFRHWQRITAFKGSFVDPSPAWLQASFRSLSRWRVVMYHTKDGLKIYLSPLCYAWRSSAASFRPSEFDAACHEWRPVDHLIGELSGCPSRPYFCHLACHFGAPRLASNDADLSTAKQHHRTFSDSICGCQIFTCLTSPSVLLDRACYRAHRVGSASRPPVRPSSGA